MFVIHFNETLYSLLILGSSIFYVAMIMLNKMNHHVITRCAVSLAPQLLTVFNFTLNTSFHPETVHYFNYIVIRFILSSFMMLPAIIVQSNEKKLLMFTFGFNVLLLLFLDTLFNAFGVGYYQIIKNPDPDYYLLNYFCAISYAFMFSFLFYGKKMGDDASLLLEIQKNEISQQNHEIATQTEELIANQEQLVNANRIIEDQKEALLKIQLGLQSELSIRNEELVQTNEELAKYNHELQQFSYSVSHNLRGPLARLLGLTNLLEKDLDGLKDGQLELVKLISRSSKELDEVVRDLGKIIDIKNDVYRIREKVFFQEEWSNVLRSLSSFIHSDIHIETDFRQAPVLYTVRPILTSILYNLVSNAIKYRSPERDPSIKIKTSTHDNLTILEVTDNGLGMTSEQCRSVFGLYKRFHSHTEGKGIGLYLVKLQIESLGGTVNVHSELNVGTTFTVTFKTPSNVEGQIVFENDFGTVFFNARHHCSGVIWKKQVTSEQYRLIFTKCAEIVRIYNPVFWFADIRQQGAIHPEDQQWLATQIFPEAARHGLRKAVVIYNEEQHNENYRERLKEAFEIHKVEAKLFIDQSEAEQWMNNITGWFPEAIQ